MRQGKEEKQPFVFNIVHKKRVYVMQANSEVEFNQWVTACAKYARFDAAAAAAAVNGKKDCVIQ